MKAYAVYHEKTDSLTVYAADKRSDAIRLAQLATEEAFQTSVPYIEFKGKRIREFDSLAEKYCHFPMLGWIGTKFDFMGRFVGYYRHGCMAGFRGDASPRTIYNAISK